MSLQQGPAYTEAFKGPFPRPEQMQRAPELQNATLLRSKRELAEASRLQPPSDLFVLTR